MDYKNAIEYIERLDHLGIKLGLSRVRKLLKLMGNPEKKLKFIHVAGTNGKGSVCAMLAEVLKQAGYKVALYTSPHLVSYRERFVINSQMISEKDFSHYVEKVKASSNKSRATLFELLTAMAIQYFSDKKVDYVILETGLGGRLDATNVVKPIVSVITNISKEHTSYLGNTIKSIAKEKAGIIKKYGVVVTGAEGIAFDVIRSAAKKMNADCYRAEKKIPKYNLKLSGEFQKRNLSVALKTIEVLNNYYQLKISDKSIRQGLSKVRWPARFEFIKKNILVDSAHNQAGFKAIVDELKDMKKYKQIVFLLSIMKDKEIRSMLKEIDDVADSIVFTQTDIKNSAKPFELAKSYSGKAETYLIDDPKTAFSHAKKLLKKDSLLVITGSIYFVGMLKSMGMFK